MTSSWGLHKPSKGIIQTFKHYCLTLDPQSLTLHPTWPPPPSSYINLMSYQVFTLRKTFVFHRVFASIVRLMILLRWLNVFWQRQSAWSSQNSESRFKAISATKRYCLPFSTSTRLQQDRGRDRGKEDLKGQWQEDMRPHTLEPGLGDKSIKSEKSGLSNSQRLSRPYFTGATPMYGFGIAAYGSTTRKRCFQIRKGSKWPHFQVNHGSPLPLPTLLTFVPACNVDHYLMSFRCSYQPCKISVIFNIHSCTFREKACLPCYKTYNDIRMGQFWWTLTFPLRERLKFRQTILFVFDQNFEM